MKIALPTASILFRAAALFRGVAQLRGAALRRPVTAVCAAVLLLSSSLSALFLFRYAPSQPLWNEFRVLAVPSDVSEAAVLSLLENAGIGPVISPSGRSPFASPPEAPVQPDSDVYYNESFRYFSDRDGGYTLFFLPDAKGLEKHIASAFAGSGIGAVLDGGFVWNPLPAFFLAVLGGIFFFFSKQKWFFLPTALPFLFFALCSPLFSVCAGSCFVLAFLFRIEKFWKRSASPADLFKEPLLFFLLLLSLAFFIAGGKTTALLSLCCFIASGAVVFLLYTGGCTRERNRRLRERQIFIPVPIMPTSALIATRSTFLRTMVPLWICLLLTAFFFIFSRGFTPAAAADGLSIPAPTGYTENAVFDTQELEYLETVRPAQGLPDLADFIRFQWNIQTFPYRSVHSEGRNSPEENTAGIIRYEADENGKIRARMEQVKLFNNQFITDIIEREKNGKLTLESMLISQGRFTAVGYRGFSAGGGLYRRGERNDTFVLYLILILVLPGAAILIHKGSKHGRAI
ncbi:MAG: hypothetical protein LBR47_04110 [Spirochaetaceae bacterium]|jgi:hypothetical protein|nr:hypothetical protein [Spirochaetaceae bacterium]